uniref:Putative HNH homing endonuclease n=1 Tax=Oedocladium carolinianum TaxID=55992 RepID=A0A8K1JA33_9CHLO|nr:hypothetical protein [Oedocladium carolinianum]UCS09805.1 putative HNH homing endonuclease [Oedocladium carolinianum]
MYIIIYMYNVVKGGIDISKKLTKIDIENLALARNHLLITSNFEEVYKSVKSALTFQCLTCQSTFECTVHSYKNAKKTGCPKCKKVKISETHKGKMVSKKTRTLISEKASRRPGSLKNKFGEDHPKFKGGYGRDKKTRSTLDYCWMNGIKKLYNRTCILTGVKQKLECHHLDSWDHAIDKRHDLKNGVLITYEVHDAFHKTYGYGKNTEAQFSEFCKNRYNVDSSLRLKLNKKSLMKGSKNFVKSIYTKISLW